MLEILLNAIEEYGKYKGVLRLDGETCDNFVAVSDVKRIIKEHLVNIPKCSDCSRRKFYVMGYEDGAKAVKDCSTCANNVEFPPPHTCDECTSLVNDEDYTMWEPKI